MAEPIRVCRLETMEYTPFAANDPPPDFKAAGITYVEKRDCRRDDIVIARSLLPLRKLGQWPMRVAVWTNEPRFDLHLASPARVPGIAAPVHIMNAYTGVYGDNYLGLLRDTEVPDRDTLLSALAAKPWRSVMLATYYSAAIKNLGLPFPPDAAEPSLKPGAHGQLFRDGRDVDLAQRRQMLAQLLHRRRFCDIYGLRWPPPIAVSGESRFNNWPNTKQAILQGYAINLAFENTIAAHYISEKIWDSIKGACLPVYHGGDGSSIYEEFPQGSFIDSTGRSTEAIADEIMAMGRREAADRYEACLDVYLRLVHEQRYRQSYADLLKRTVAFLQDIADRAAHPTATQSATSPPRSES